MRILAHVHGYPLAHNAGAEWGLHWIMAGMAERGHECRVITSAGTLGNWHGSLNGVEVLPDTSATQEEEYRAADLVVTHLDRTRIVVELAKKYTKPLVHLVHNQNQLRFHGVRPSEAALVVFNSIWLADAVKWKGPQIVVPPPVAVEHYWTERHPDADYITLLNLSEAKGGSILPELARRLPNHHFLGVGGGYAKQVTAAEVPPNLTYINNQTDVREVFRYTRTLLMPSLHETWGRAAVEAACSGIPTIAHPSDGLKEAMSEAAIWCHRDDLDAWEAAILSLDDAERYQAWSERAEARAMALDPKPSLDELERTFRSLVAEGTRVDGSSFFGHFLDHIEPVWRHLPPEHRGHLLIGGNYLRHALARGCVAWPFWTKQEHMEALHQSRGPVLVSSSYDMEKAEQAGRTVFLMEHGAGQGYVGQHNASYIGGPGRAKVGLFINPGPKVTAENLRTYPEKLNVEVGCPKLDRWMGWQPPPAPKPIVCLSFHWRATIVPEAGTAFQHYRDGLSKNMAVRELLHERYRMVAHAHPRIIAELRPWFEGYGFELWTDFEQVLEYAHCYVIDNSSTLFEFASTGRPVVVMNDPKWRRNVNHGLRFWEFADVGPQVNCAEELPDAIALALSDPEELRARREEVSNAIYSFRDGYSADRAAKAIVEHGLDRALQLAMENPGMIEMIAAKNFVGLRGEGHGQHGMVMRGSTFFVAGESRATALEKQLLARRKKKGDVVDTRPLEQRIPQIAQRFPELRRAPLQLGGKGGLSPSETKENPQKHIVPATTPPSAPAPSQAPSAPSSSPPSATEQPSAVVPPEIEGLKPPGEGGPAFKCETAGCDLVFKHPKWRHKHQVDAGHIVSTGAQQQAGRV